MIAGIAKLLREDKISEQAPLDVALHGENRWRQSFNLPELVHDWGHLNAILVDEFCAFFRQGNLSEELRREALARLTRFASTSLSVSVGEYERLRQYEAASIFKDLERSRESDQDVVKHRARALREYAHDMRGSLSALAGAGAVMASAKLSSQRLEELADVIDVGVRAISEMLETLLELSRLEAGLESVRLERIRVRDLADELERLLQPLAEGKSLELEFSGDPSLEVETDASKLRRILQNLLVNAVKYTDRGTVRLLWERSPADRWCLRVEDTGPGMQIDMGSFIAQQTADPELEKPAPHVVRHGSDAAAWKGEGIGLSIVKRLCVMLDILIELKTEPGKGTCFILTAPIDYSHVRS